MKSGKSSPYVFIKWLIVMVGFFSLHACKPKDQECYQTTVIMNYSRFLWRDSMKVYQAIDSFHGDSIYKPRFTDSQMIAPELVAIPYGSDSVYSIIGQRTNSVLYGPLDPDKDSIRYRFRTDTASEAFDTLTFYYEPQVHFINNACGYTYYYNLTNVKTTLHMLDSAAIIIKNVTNTVPNPSNVNFYFQKRK